MAQKPEIEPQAVDQETLEKIIKQEEKDVRNLSGFWKYLISALSVFMVGFYFFSSGLVPQNVELHRGIYVMITFVTIFLLYPFHASNTGLLHRVIMTIPEGLRKILFNRNRPGLFDITLAIISILTVGYWIAEYANLNYRAGAYTDLDYMVSLVGLLIGLEISRRILGWSMTLVGIGFLLYTLFGDILPEPFDHRGFSLHKSTTYFFLEQDGVFGVMADVLATYVILFIFFGAFLRKSGAASFFMDFPMALAGRSTGGPAKVAVMASAMFGSISGSAIANTVSTGTFTIPLMKRAGFRPHIAGAIEPAASIGGMFMPPVMGAGGFLMAELTGISYTDIMIMSVFPALIYFLSVFVAIHFEAKKYNIKGIPESEIGKPMDVLRKQWYMSLPLVIIVVLMLVGYSPGFAAFWATLSCIALSWVKKETRMGIREIYDAMLDGAKGTLVIGATVGVIGIIIGSIALTGIGLKFSDIIISMANGNLVIAILLIGLASLVLGMGVPVTAAYLITAVLAVPALKEMGVLIIAAHQLVYWFSQDSNITPPVAVAAYAGAAIAGSDPWKTGWASFRYAKMLYIMPFLFAYTPAVLLQGSTTEIITSFATTTLGTIFFGSVTMGYLLRNTKWYEWVVLALATGLTFVPYLPYYPIGIGLYLVIFFWQKFTLKQASAGGAA